MNLDRDLATEMETPKYAHFERERRWLVDRDAQPDVQHLNYTLIEDRYLHGSRLRLRRMTKPGEAWSAYKLTKKYECHDPANRPIVTAYLTQEEYALFLSLPGCDLVKRRYRQDHDGQVWSLDVFAGDLAGLITVEAEVATNHALARLTPPPWTSREITHEVRYQCGALAHSRQVPEDR